jgi:hypothetical protein
MRQKSFTAEDFDKYRKKTRKEAFLSAQQLASDCMAKE